MLIKPDVGVIYMTDQAATLKTGTGYNANRPVVMG